MTDEYEVVKDCGWGAKSWKPGDRIKAGEIPPEVVKVLLRTKSVRKVG